MANELKLRRGTTAQHATFTGAEGEVTVDLTKDTLVVHDGATAGGHPLAKSAELTAHTSTTSAHGVTGDIVGTSSTQTLTNKTINGSNNTVTNIPLDTGTTGTLSVSRGGTGLTSPGAAGNIIFSTGSGLESGPPPASMPAGSVIYTAMDSAPTGYIKANGAAVSRTTYAALFAAIGTTFGAGDGSTTFALPDLRGEFIRGWDDGRSIDTGRAFGSAQADANKLHGHAIYTSGWAGRDGTNRGIVSDQNDTLRSPNLESPTATGGGLIGGNGDDEARPRNIALLACIKF